MLRTNQKTDRGRLRDALAGAACADVLLHASQQPLAFLKGNHPCKLFAVIII